MNIGLLVAFIISWLSVAAVSYLSGYRHGKDDIINQILEQEGEVLKVTQNPLKTNDNE